MPYPQASFEQALEMAGERKMEGKGEGKVKVKGKGKGKGKIENKEGKTRDEVGGKECGACRMDPDHPDHAR